MALPAPSSPGGCSAPDPPLQPRSVLGRPILQGVSPGHSNQPSAPEHGVSQHRVTDWGAGRASKCQSLCPLHIGTKAVSSGRALGVLMFVLCGHKPAFPSWPEGPRGDPGAVPTDESWEVMLSSRDPRPDPASGVVISVPPPEKAT